MRDLAQAVCSAPDDALNKLARQTELYAQSRGMTVLPVMPDFAESVVLDEQLLSAEQAVDAAVAAGGGKGSGPLQYRPGTAARWFRR